jgi:coenzyme PQQ synthesis protein D (PqqD)
VPLMNSLSWFRRRLAGKCRPRVDAQGGNQRNLVAAREVRASVHDDGLALLDLSTGKVFLCNETGSLIWQGIVAGLTPDAICEEISREFGVAADLVRRQTAAFLMELERRGLVVRRLECDT